MKILTILAIMLAIMATGCVTEPTLCDEIDCEPVKNWSNTAYECCEFCKNQNISRYHYTNEPYRCRCY